MIMLSRRAALKSGAAALALAMASPSGLLAQSSTPIRGGALVVSADVQPLSLDPVKGNAPTGDRYTMAHIFDSLLKMDAKGTVGPNLAEKWEYVDNNLGLVLQLRKDVVFHDGTPFNAEAVKANIERTINPETKSLKATDLAGVKSVEVIDEFTAKIVFDSVNAGVLASLAVETGMMSSPKALKEMSPQDYGLNPVGTGAFVFKEWVIGSHVDLVRNDKYWRQGTDGKALPYLDTLRVRYITNPPVKMVEIQAGSISLADNIPPKEFAAIEANPDLVSVAVPPGIVQWVAFNNERSPMTDIRVRRAFSMAMDRKFMLDLISEGYGQISRGPVSPNGWDFDPSIPADVPYDIEGAKKLLAEAGYPDGIKLSLLINQRDPDTLIAQVIQQQVADAGIELTIDAPDRSALPPLIAAGNWDTFLGRVNVPRADPDHMYGLTYSRNSSSQNFAKITDEEMFAAVDAGRTSVDRDERRKQYLRVQQIVHDNAYYAFLFFREVRHVARKELRNLTVDVGGAWDLGAVWLEK